MRRLLGKSTTQSLRMASLCAVLLACLGCARERYRLMADNEVYGLLEGASQDCRWELRNYTIDLNPKARFFDPYGIDYPPMPQDDPTAHRLMHCVDGKKGFPCWHKNGDIQDVETADWLCSLPRGEDGVVKLDRRAAIETALLHSREYRTQTENLYLSALDVAFERFRFDAQFFGGNSVFYNSDGRLRTAANNSRSDLANVNDLQFRKLYASGGTLVADVTNTLMWQFSGPDGYNANTLLDFTFTQPLLRAGSRAQVLERLTIVERNLLYNVRQMELYRRGFFINLMTGAGTQQGPQRRGGVFGAPGLNNFSGVGGGGFGRLGAGQAGVAAQGAGADRAGGLYGLLQQQIEIQNQQANVAGLRDSLAQLQAAYDAGRLDRFQVDLARQNLYQLQSALLNAKAVYQATIDNYKILLGLPPSLPVEMEDRMLDRFRLIDSRVTATQDQMGVLLDDLRNPDIEPTAESVAQWRQQAEQLRRQTASHVTVVEADIERLNGSLNDRREGLRRLASRPEVRQGQVEATPYSPAALEQRVREVHQDFASLNERYEQTAQRLTQHLESAETAADFRRQLLDYAAQLSSILAELSLLQARARLDAATLVHVDFTAEQGIRMAAENRLDWMNARASLVDSWRLVEFNANALKSDLSVIFSGDLNTTDNNPVRFRGPTGRLRVGLQYDAPLTRMSERNTYRQSLIEYQQARRNYMAFRDQIHLAFRNRQRQVQLNQLNFETRRAAVTVTINQVEQTRLRLDKPPQPGETSTLTNTTARDLVDALRNLTQAQNDFVSVWVNYEVQRLGLDFDLGTMKMDDCGQWIDPGAVNLGGRDAGGESQSDNGPTQGGALPAGSEYVPPGVILPGDVPQADADPTPQTFDPTGAEPLEVSLGPNF